jgi:hypothetical protein
VGSRFEGLRIFDVTNPFAPLHITSVGTVCGSHTHTTIPDNDDQRLIVYVSSNPSGQGTVFCPQPHAKISIVEVPYANPAAARLLKEQPLHSDTPEHVIFGRSVGVACHDITAFLDRKRPIAFAACQSEVGGTSVFDFTNPAAPREVGFFDPSGIDGQGEAETWSSYWYNGYIYARDHRRGSTSFGYVMRKAGPTEREAGIT